MKQLRIINLSILSLYILLILSSCQTKTNKKEKVNQLFPSPIGYINDYANVLDSLDILKLESKLDSLDKNTTKQIAVISINSSELTEENFNQYALDLSNYWGVGKKENNGLTIVFSPELRKIRICTGLNVENILTDEICKNVIDSTIVPEFKNGNYYSGLNNSLDNLIRLWK
ncbi:MAG: TPM domain-containing protein [Chitinophagales bacterium]|nr:TPM domain-containing protein [Chitinophagales bacterium]